jgi:dihydrofolate synthase / folylpolyglutamate synthase
MTGPEAERYLLSLELFGMRFGLDRMRRLMTALGHPERRFDSIHVVGTNGKSSTVRMIAAIIAHHGLRTGAYLSPHLVSFGERIRIDDRDLEPAAFGAAVDRAARAAARVDRSAADDDDRVTQFEVLTAAAYSELAERGVEVAVIEAGLGGRYDATNVIPSKVQVLTSVGLEHTRWLGPTLTDIATEKLDVVQPGETLVLGAGLEPEVMEVAERVASERDARIVLAGTDPGVPVGAPGAYQRRNFALARAAAEAFLGSLSEEAVTAAAADVRVPGRLQQIDVEPVTLVDGAHNVDGMRALAESLPEVTAGRGPVIAVLSILDDKDAAGMLAALGAGGVRIDALVLTSSQNPRALPPPTL